MKAAPKLTPREKTLATIVAVILLVLLNLVALDFLFRKQARLRTDHAAKTLEWQAMQALAAERELWLKRDAWLRGKQPKLTNEGQAGVQLLDQVKQLGKAHNITIENPAIASPERTPNYRSVGVNIEAKSAWNDLIKFLHGLQGPEQFVVVESANIRRDDTDPTQMRCKFKIAKWYAPEPGASKPPATR